MPWVSRTVEIANPTAYPEKGDLCWKAIKRLPTGFRASRPHTRDGAELLNPHFTICPGVVSASVSVVRFLAMPLSKWWSHSAREWSGRLGAVSGARKTHRRKPHSLAQSTHTYQTASFIGAAKTGICLAWHTRKKVTFACRALQWFTVRIGLRRVKRLGFLGEPLYSEGLSADNPHNSS